MELWVPITLAAAFLQNLRSALQKHLKGSLSTYGATFCRFVYAAPLALAYVFLLGEGYGFEWPAPNPRFAIFAMLGGGRPDHRDRPPRLPLLASQLRGRHHLLQDRDGAGPRSSAS